MRLFSKFWVSIIFVLYYMLLIKIEKIGEIKLWKCLGKWVKLLLFFYILCIFVILFERVKVIGILIGYYIYFIFVLCVDVLKDLV